MAQATTQPVAQSTATVQPAATPQPGTAAQPGAVVKPKKPKKWPWIVGIVVALAIGVVIGLVL